MNIYVLSSGSCGNCTFVQSGGTRILVDAGLPGSTVKRYLERINEKPEDVDAVLLTHEHRDHTRGAGVLSRRYGTHIYATKETFLHSQHITNGIATNVSCMIDAGEEFIVGNFVIESVSTPHDARNSVGYVIEADGVRFGVFTDFGHVFDGLSERMSTFDAMMLETNYDEDMLENGPYPEVLRKRIRGNNGHLSNDDAAGLLTEHAGNRLKTVFLSHLSEENNRPDCVIEALVRKIDSVVFEEMNFVMTKRGFPTELVTLRSIQDE